MSDMLISWTNSLARSPSSRHAGGLRVSALALVALAVAGCNTRGGPIPYEVTNFTAPDAPAAASLPEYYRIAPLDTLRVSVFQVEDLTGDYQVDLGGNIAMPLIGSVPAVGLTIDELKQRLVARLGERYLNNPDITVGVASSSQLAVTVDGSVRRPGPIPLQGRMTLMQAVANAGGTDENSNPRRVAIFRTIDGRRMAAAFDLTRIRRGETEDPQVYRGDIIVVDGSRMRAIFRDIVSTVPLLGYFGPI